MEIQGKTVLVLGAAGLVGQALCKKLIEENAGTLILASLHEHEVDHLEETLRKASGAKTSTIQKTWGNFLVRHEWKDFSKEELLADPKIRHQWILDTIEPLTRKVLTASEIYCLCQHYRPEIIIDAVNFATSLSYQDLFAASKETLNVLRLAEREKSFSESAIHTVEKLLLTQYTPHVIRHVQNLFQSMVEAGVKFYLKIGTSGTGGMGLNIPFTHSEDKPSQTQLAKSALAGAHTLLLFLMARTPGGPIIKELKPTAAIAWKQIGFGPITKQGRPLLLEDVALTDAVSLAGQLKKSLGKRPKHLKHNGEPKALTAPFIDLGENGLYALGEFEALTDEGQMEFITPEEIAQTAIWEIKGGNTGRDIVAALDNSTMGPTYRAGLLREPAIDRLRELIQKTGVDSVAFELLGPPRLSKILYEAYLLKKCYGTFEAVLGCEAKEIADKLEQCLLEEKELRAKIISIGIPILLANGTKLLRGSKIAIPADVPGQPDAQFEITESHIDRWAHDGWIDLRQKNIESWQKRLQIILDQIKTIRSEDSSSAHPKDRYYWEQVSGKTPIEIGRLASWILTNEEMGFRMKG